MPQGAIFAAIARKFSGAVGPVQLDQQSAIWDSNRHGKHYASVYGTAAKTSPVTAAVAGSSFRCANQSSATVSAALAATYTGLCLSNPAGSTVNLSVKRVGGIITSAPGGMLGLGLIIGWLAAGITAHTSPLDTSIVNNYIGAAASGSPPVAGPASQAHVDAACTLVGTPTWAEWLVGNVATTNNPWFITDLDDSFLITPGGYLAIGATSSNAGFFGSFMWEELPQ
jgi:hypothetical protein